MSVSDRLRLTVSVNSSRVIISSLGNAKQPVARDSETSGNLLGVSLRAAMRKRKAARWRLCGFSYQTHHGILYHFASEIEKAADVSTRQRLLSDFVFPTQQMTHTNRVYPIKRDVQQVVPSLARDAVVFFYVSPRIAINETGIQHVRIVIA